VVPGLCRFFLRRYDQMHGRKVSGFEREAEEAILSYPWPGNIRELENAIEHAVIMAETERIRLSDLPESVLRNPRPMLRLPPGREIQPDPKASLRSLADVEREHILAVLAAVSGNQTEASHVLGIGRSTLWRKLREYGLASGAEEPPPAES
jgi:two-component system response regulator HydG